MLTKEIGVDDGSYPVQPANYSRQQPLHEGNLCETTTLHGATLRRILGNFDPANRRICVDLCSE